MPNMLRLPRPCASHPPDRWSKVERRPVDGAGEGLQHDRRLSRKTDRSASYYWSKKDQGNFQALTPFPSRAKRTLEIAEIMGITEADALMRVHRAISSTKRKKVRTVPHGELRMTPETALINEYLAKHGARRFRAGRHQWHSRDSVIHG